MAMKTTPILKSKPFLKWAGGKTQLLPKIDAALPHKELNNGTLKKYVEPFVGSGAVLFHILEKYPQISEIYINDINIDLINVYVTIKINVLSLISILDKIEKEYLPLEHEQRKEYYYKIRKIFNDTQIDEKYVYSNNDIAINRAAQFIFLNRTCFNGLYRVNKKGEFNVPMGQYKNPKICNTPLLKSVHRALQKVSIYSGDYKNTESVIDNSSFVYFDPPYRPITTSSNFTSYSSNGFDDANQIELSNYFNLLNNKGAYLMLSNSDPKNVDHNDNFFDDLYKSFNINRVNATRRINSNASKRGVITELLITNY